MSKLLKCCTGTILAALLVFSCFFAVAAEHTQPEVNITEDDISMPLIGESTTLGSVSGNYRNGERTKDEIVSAWRSASSVYCGSIYSSQPSAVSPYSAGSLSSGYLGNTVDYVNYYRFLAKLPAITTSTEKNNISQHGAVLLAKTKMLSHSIAKPSDMSNSFYDTASASIASSNIAYINGGDTYVLRETIDSYMDASSTASTLKYAMHRRWVLSPYLSKTGFGLATADNGDRYSTMYIFDNQQNTTAYNFISWPPSGYCPNDVITTDAPWSISLNPNKYAFSNPSALTVTVTRESTNETFTLNSRTGTPSKEKPYLTADYLTYAVPMTIVFSIGSENHLEGELWGDFDVKVEGLTSVADGSPVTLTYTTSFFSIESAAQEDTTQPETTTTTTRPTTTTTTTRPTTTTTTRPTTTTTTTRPTTTTTTRPTTTTTTRPTTTTTTVPATTVSVTQPQTSTPQKVKSISVEEKPAKLKYGYKDSLDTSGLKLKVTYTDGKTAYATSGFSCSPGQLNKTGTQKITVEYGGCQTSYSVTVNYTAIQWIMVIFLFGWLWL